MSEEMFYNRLIVEMQRINRNLENINDKLADMMTPENDIEHIEYAEQISNADCGGI